MRMDRMREQKEEVASVVKIAILHEGKLRRNSAFLEDVKISKLETIHLTACENQDSNYSFTGTATITRIIETKNGNDVMEFPNCSISGYAMVEGNNVTIVNGVSVDNGLPQFPIKK